MTLPEEDQRAGIKGCAWGLAFAILFWAALYVVVGLFSA
jgi:hypothetical protein